MEIKLWIYRLLVMTLILSFFITILNYFVDPFQHYRVSTWYKITEKKQRSVTPGLAKNMFYETAIIGSSMAENFHVSQINEELNTKSLKLCMSAITAYEMSQLLNVIFKYNSKIKRIVILLDPYSLSGDSKRTHNMALPIHLYDDNIINDIKYLLNKETLKFTLKTLTRDINKETDFDKIWSWETVDFSKKTVLKTYGEAHFNSSFTPKMYTYNVLRNSFDLNILQYIERKPDIKFAIVFPPYSYLTYKDMKIKKWLKEVFKLKQYLVNLSLVNVDIYDFQCVPSITENLNNYKDISHYSPTVNAFIVSSIKAKSYILNPRNIEKCLEVIDKSAKKMLIR